MNVNVKFRWIWVLAFLLAAPWAMAQKDIPVYGFAGEDYTFLNQDHNLNYVDLGLDEIYDNDDSYYEWSLISAPDGYEEPYLGTIAPEINGGNVHVHRLRAAVSVPGDYSFQCVRLSKYGYQKDFVVITVIDYPAIKTITNRNKRECWMEGDSITIDQFDIVTDPPGLSELVSLADDSKVAQGSSAANVLTGASDQTLSFLIRSNNGDVVMLSDKTHTIEVYQDVNHSVGADPIFDDILPSIEKLNNLGETLSEKIVDRFPKKLKDQLPVNITATVYASPSFYQDCCNGRETNHMQVELGGVLGVSFEANIYVFPALLVYVGIVGEVAAKPNLTLDFVSDEAVRYGCENDATVKIDVHGEIGGQVGIGTSGQTAAPVAIGVKGQVVGAVDFSLVMLTHTGNKNWDFRGFQFSLIIRVVADYAIGSYTWEYVAKESDTYGD